MGRILDSLITKQIRLESIREAERELYQYGYLIMCEWGFNIVMAVLIAFMTGAVQTTIIFLLSIIPLRGFAGGYYASAPDGVRLCQTDVLQLLYSSLKLYFVAACL